jgi:hypothetical protein
MRPDRVRTEPQAWLNEYSISTKRTREFIRMQFRIAELQCEEAQLT